MVFFKHYSPSPVETVFELYNQYRVGYWGIIQTIFFMISITLIVTEILSYIANLDGEAGSIGSFLGDVGIGFWIGFILLIPSFFPGGFGLYNMWRCGTCYLSFDLGTQEIYVITGHWYNLKFKKTTLCPYTQFKGIAKSEKKNELLLLCYSRHKIPTDSLLIYTPKEKYYCFGLMEQNGKLSVTFDGVSKYWMENCTEYMEIPDDPEKEVPIFFGIVESFTKPFRVPNGDGTISEINVNYSYHGYDKDNTEILDLDHREVRRGKDKVIDRQDVDADGDSVVDEVGPDLEVQKDYV